MFFKIVILTDIDECAENTDSCDSKTTKCRNTRGGYECDCLSGLKHDGDYKCVGKRNYCLIEKNVRKKLI